MTITQRSDSIINILFYLWTLTIFYSIYAALRRTRQGLCCICRFRLYSTILGSKLSCLIELQLAFKTSVYLSLHQCSITRHFPPLIVLAEGTKVTYMSSRLCLADSLLLVHILSVTQYRRSSEHTTYSQDLLRSSIRQDHSVNPRSVILNSPEGSVKCKFKVSSVPAVPFFFPGVYSVLLNFIGNRISAILKTLICLGTYSSSSYCSLKFSCNYVTMMFFGWNQTFTLAILILKSMSVLDFSHWFYAVKLISF